jgi:hypothetical protein
MFNWFSKSKADPPTAISLSKLTKEDILFLQYNENADIIFDFNRLGFLQTKRLIKNIYPLIRDSTNPKLELLARTIYSLSKMKVKYVEAYFNQRPLFCEDCEYIATVEATKKPNSNLIRVETNIYPFSIQCLSCYKIANSGWGIVPLRKMYIDELHQLIKQCQTLQEFKQNFDFHITYPYTEDELPMFFDSSDKLNIVEIILNGAHDMTLTEAKRYIQKFNMNFEAIKSEIENKLFERLKTNINENKWGTLLDMQLLYNYSVYDESYIITYPDKIKETFKKICEKKGGIII